MNRGNPDLITILSGKGGVGKTGLTLNLATLLAAAGKRVLVVDADTGLANADVQLNLKPARDLGHVLAGQANLAEAITPTPQGFDLIAGRSGYAGLVNVPLPTLAAWLNELRALARDYDHVFLDAAAGIAPGILLLAAQSARSLLITTPDPSSLTDAYAVLKLLWQQHHSATAVLVVNQASPREATMVHERLNTATEAFLQRPPLVLAGQIPACRQYAAAVRSHALAAVQAPHSPALESIGKLARWLGETRPQG